MLAANRLSMMLWTAGIFLSKLTEYNTDMRNTCFATGLAECLLKEHIRCEMTSLLYEMANNSADVSFAVNKCGVDTKHFTTLKKRMSVVRGVSNEWTDMLGLCINMGEPISEL